MGTFRLSFLGLWTNLWTRPAEAGDGRSRSLLVWPQPHTLFAALVHSWSPCSATWVEPWSGISAATAVVSPWTVSKLYWWGEVTTVTGIELEDHLDIGCSHICTPQPRFRFLDPPWPCLSRMDRGNYNFRWQCRWLYRQLHSDFRELFGAVPLVKLPWWRRGRCMEKAWPFWTPCDSACSSSGPEVVGVRALLFLPPSPGQRQRQRPANRWVLRDAAQCARHRLGTGMDPEWLWCTYTLPLWRGKTLHESYRPGWLKWSGDNSFVKRDLIPLWRDNLISLWRDDLIPLWRDNLISLWRDDLIPLWRGNLISLWRGDLIPLWRDNLISLWRGDLISLWMGGIIEGVT